MIKGQEYSPCGTPNKTGSYIKCRFLELEPIMKIAVKSIPELAGDSYPSWGKVLLMKPFKFN